MRRKASDIVVSLNQVTTRWISDGLMKEDMRNLGSAGSSMDNINEQWYWEWSQIEIWISGDNMARPVYLEDVNA